MAAKKKSNQNPINGTKDDIKSAEDSFVGNAIYFLVDPVPLKEWSWQLSRSNIPRYKGTIKSAKYLGINPEVNLPDYEFVVIGDSGSEKLITCLAYDAIVRKKIKSIML